VRGKWWEYYVDRVVEDRWPKSECNYNLTKQSIRPRRCWKVKVISGIKKKRGKK
jgi:hypothetical protein